MGQKISPRRPADLVLRMDYDSASGWSPWEVQPFGPIEFDPTALGLHYAQQVFEGIRATLMKDDTVVCFRMKDYLARLSRSAKRLAMPAFSEDALEKGIEELLRVNRKLMDKENPYIYIRPMIIATEPSLGVRVSNQYMLMVIMGYPGVGAGMDPKRFWVLDNISRPAKGGLAGAKAAVNYPSHLYMIEKMRAAGCSDHPIYLGGSGGRIEEVATASVFFKSGNKLLTPKVDNIIQSVTRASIIDLALDRGIEVAECDLQIDDVLSQIEDGSINESFTTGTALGITPISGFVYKEKLFELHNKEAGQTTRDLYAALIRAREGKDPLHSDWTTVVA